MFYQVELCDLAKGPTPFRITVTTWRDIDLWLIVWRSYLTSRCIPNTTHPISVSLPKKEGQIHNNTTTCGFTHTHQTMKTSQIQPTSFPADSSQPAGLKHTFHRTQSRPQPAHWISTLFRLRAMISINKPSTKLKSVYNSSPYHYSIIGILAVTHHKYDWWRYIKIHETYQKCLSLEHKERPRQDCWLHLQ